MPRWPRSMIRDSWTRLMWPACRLGPWIPPFRINFSGPLTWRFELGVTWTPKWSNSPLGGPAASSRPSHGSRFLACLGDGDADLLRDLGHLLVWQWSP